MTRVGSQRHRKKKLALCNFSSTQFSSKEHFPLASSRQSTLATRSRNKIVLVLAIKAYRGSGVTAPLVTNLGISCRSVGSSTLRPIYLRVEVRVPIDQDHGWAKFVYEVTRRVTLKSAGIRFLTVLQAKELKFLQYVNKIPSNE